MVVMFHNFVESFTPKSYDKVNTPLLSVSLKSCFKTCMTEVTGLSA